MNAFFHAARPVWLRGWHEQMNITAGLRRVLDLPAPVRAVLRLTARTAYRAWVDGAFAGCGPARSAHGTARVDEWQLELTAGRHVVAIEINAANIPAYALTDERPGLRMNTSRIGDFRQGLGKFHRSGDRQHSDPQTSHAFFRRVPRSHGAAPIGADIHA